MRRFALVLASCTAWSSVGCGSGSSVASARPDASPGPSSSEGGAPPPPDTTDAATMTPDAAVTTASCWGLAAQRLDNVWSLTGGAHATRARRQVPDDGERLS